MQNIQMQPTKLWFLSEWLLWASLNENRVTSVAQFPEK